MAFRHHRADVHSRMQIKASGRHHLSTRTINSHTDRARAGLEAQAPQLMAHTLPIVTLATFLPATIQLICTMSRTMDAVAAKMKRREEVDTSKIATTITGFVVRVATMIGATSLVATELHLLRWAL
jgi:hypothetical protein